MSNFSFILKNKMRNDMVIKYSHNSKFAGKALSFYSFYIAVFSSLVKISYVE